MKKTATIILILIIGFVILYFWPDIDPVEDDPDLRDPEELTAISSAMREFSFNSFLTLAEADENLFISPYSIHTALIMAYRGADGETATEMREVLGLNEMEMEALMEDSLGLKKYLEHFSDENEVAIANAFFLREDIPFLENYKTDGEKYFEAEIGPLPETGEPINDWVYENTREKIEEIIDPGPIDEDVVSYLINAIYFKGIWAEEFDEAKTTERDFQSPEGEVPVEMMENEGDYLYGISENLKSITMKYEDGDYLFHAFMPTDDRNLSEFYEEFDPDYFSEMKPTEEGEVVLRFPKFTMEDKFSMVDALMEMGMEKSFDRNEADFSNMIDLEALELNVFISDVLHASFIEVDEKGTEAAAATAVEMRLESAPMILEFNRPFLFVIEEPETETILFIGQLVNPEN